MSSLNSRKGRKIHTRNIEISTYESGGENIIVEGILKEDRLIPFYQNSGKKHPPQTVHNMIIQILVECSSLTIREINVEMPATPHEDCIQTSNSLQKLKGLRIAPGFTSKVKKALGGINGCLHLTTLVLAMAPAIIQGYWVYRNKEKGDNEISPEIVKDYLIDTCWVWRKDGPLVEELKQNGNYSGE
ncbi:MAG: DUF2889 domain-containing protein [Deltaproteobacteria bacterium]|nr:DUF2889 domain-containing protein [Deltaproteobacteria bacterium]